MLFKKKKKVNVIKDKEIQRKYFRLEKVKKI